jgi:DSBA-like thioredoxin domain
VLKELPVLGRDSEDVARIAQAAILQGKYLELHRRLIGERGRTTKDKALRIASELGFDTATLERDMHSQGVDDAIVANGLLADRLGVRGVPFYLVGDRAVRRADEDLYPQLAAGVADVRQNGCDAACWGLRTSVGHGERELPPLRRPRRCLLQGPATAKPVTPPAVAPLSTF